MEQITIGVDEAGRGPLFGDVYTGAVILPESGFDVTMLKDSKKFTSKKKIKEVYQYIRTNSFLFSIDYCTHEEVDMYNILQATQRSMHKSVRNVVAQWVETFGESFNPSFFGRLFIHVDGNYFNDFNYFYKDQIYHINHKTLVKGDSLCKSISAASILAKVERDQYIEAFLEENPEYDEKYKLSTNKGYGTKAHLNGIRAHGYSPFHRKSFKVKSL
jgi:ribonuclease HII